MNLSFVLACVVALLVTTTGTPSTAAPRADRPHNLYVVVIDASGSYQKRQLEAVDKAKSLLDVIESRRLRPKEQPDRVAVIALDATPEVIWRGDARRLATTTRADWQTRFAGRGDYASCTDVEAGLALALRELAADPAAVGRRLLVFSDLVHEPPSRSIRACRKPTLPSVPGPAFPWAAFDDPSLAVDVFWMPPDQKLAWKRAVDQNGLGERFALYTESESAEVQLSPLPQARRERTEADRDVARSTVATVASGLGRSALAIAATLASAIAFAVWRRRRTSAPATRAPLPPPLSLPPRSAAGNHRRDA